MAKTSHTSGGERAYTGRRLRLVGRRSHEETPLADDEDWIAVQEF